MPLGHLARDGEDEPAVVDLGNGEYEFDLETDENGNVVIPGQIQSLILDQWFYLYSTHTGSSRVYGKSSIVVGFKITDANGNATSNTVRVRFNDSDSTIAIIDLAADGSWYNYYLSISPTTSYYMTYTNYGSVSPLKVRVQIS